MRDYLTKEDKRLIALLNRRTNQFRKSVKALRKHNQHLRASFWLDRIDATEKIIRDIKCGLYQGELE